MKRIIIFLIVVSVFLTITASISLAGSAAVEIQNKGKDVINALLWMGYAIALGMVIYIGIKYMLGAADAKANMKNAIVGWLIGAFIVFMATTIVGWVLNAIDSGASNDSNSEAEKIVQNAGNIF